MLGIGDNKSNGARGRRGRAWGAAAIILALILIYWLRIILLPFVLAAAVAYVVAPIQRQLQRRLHLPYWLAGVILFIFILAILTGIGFWIDRVLVPQASELLRDAPSLLKALFHKLFGRDQVSFMGHQITADSLTASASATIGNLIGNPAEAIAGIMAAAMLGFVTLVLILFFLLSGPGLARGIFWLIPPGVRPTAMRILIRLRPVIRRYIEGVVIIVIITSVLSWVTLRWILGLPHATLLAITVGLLELIPVAGPITAATLICMVAVTRGSLAIIIGVGLFVMAIRLFIDQFIAPIVLGSAVRLHPAVIIFSLMVGGALFGVLGMLLAVPAAATIKVALKVIYDEDGDADEPIGS